MSPTQSGELAPFHCVFERFAAGSGFFDVNSDPVRATARDTIGKQLFKVDIKIRMKSTIDYFIQGTRDVYLSGMREAVGR
jgi:hypothetical protein